MRASARALNQVVWQALLSRLGSDSDSAGEQYELLRRRLIRFFEWKGCLACEDHADDVLTRVAQKIADGEAIGNVQAYALGVARFVLLESGGAPVQVAIDENAARAASEPDAWTDTRAECLDKCLEQLPRETRQLTLQYYEGTGGARVSNRHTMATTLGITERALRLRIFRVRETLEQCVNDCLHGSYATAG